MTISHIGLDQYVATIKFTFFEPAHSNVVDRIVLCVILLSNGLPLVWQPVPGTKGMMHGAKSRVRNPPSRLPTPALRLLSEGSSGKQGQSSNKRAKSSK